MEISYIIATIIGSLISWLFGFLCGRHDKIDNNCYGDLVVNDTELYLSINQDALDYLPNRKYAVFRILSKSQK